MKKLIIMLAATVFSANVFAQSATTQSTPSATAISITPNPFNNEVNISFVVKDDAQLNIRLYDLLGNVVQTFDNTAIQAGFHNYNYGTGNLKSGVYLIDIMVKGASFMKKIVKM